MYWLVLATFFHTHSFGTYDTLKDCKRAAETMPWYVSASCVPTPNKFKAPAQ